MSRRSLSGVLLAALSVAACSSGGQNGGNAGQPASAGSAGTPAGGGANGGADAAGSENGGSAGSLSGSGGAGAASGGCQLAMTDDAQPMLLSETGCIDMADPTRPAPGLVPYTVRSPLWSDAATKERFMRIPDGQQIHALDCELEPTRCVDPGQGGTGEDDGHFDFPIGTVLVKNFSIEGKHIETRLLMRRSKAVWKGFSYEWNDEETEATLLPDNADGKDKPVGSGAQVWHYPSRSQCLECHTKYAGRSLGPSTPQLNTEYPYADGSMNQLEKLRALGLFDAVPKYLAGLPEPFDTDVPLEARARSYIQTNCAICHRPGGEYSSIDMRFTTPFAMTNLCGASERDTDLVPAQRIVPGDPAQSALSFRMHWLNDAQSQVRMPKIGSNVVDTMGTALIDEWITSLPQDACPAPQ